MAMAIKQQLISADEFWHIVQQPDYADRRLELIDGELVEIVKPGGRHGKIAGDIFGFLWLYARQNNAGYVTAAETGYITQRTDTGRDRVRGLDAAFIRRKKCPQGLPEGHIDVAPDIAVEVLSPGNNAEDIQEKVFELLNFGVLQVWIVSIRTQTVLVYTPQNVTLLQTDDTLTGGNVLPGFSLSLSELFDDTDNEKPST
jgi:Uma2 family endonuclease